MAVSILGITGPIGCGKSTVAEMTLEMGALEVIDADRVTHELMQPGTRLSVLIGQEFGGCVLAEDGSVDRRLLAGLVFQDPDALQRLEALVHPQVRTVVYQRIAERSRSGVTGVITVEAIRLLGSPIADDAVAIWLVECDRSRQLERLTSSRGYALDDAVRRIQAQPEFDSSRITARIANNGSPEALRRRVEQEWDAAFPRT